MHLITIKIKYKLKHPQYSYNTYIPTYSWSSTRFLSHCSLL